MTMGNSPGTSFPPPPGPTLPQGAPWTEGEDIISLLRSLNSNIAALTRVTSGLGGVGVNVPITLPPSGGAAPPSLPIWTLPGGLESLATSIPIPQLFTVPDLVASAVPGNTVLTGVLTVPGTIISRLTSNYEDYGTATGGTNTLLKDTSKSWSTNDWSGHRLFIYKQSVLYETNILSNDNVNLTIPALPGGVIVDSQTVYWILPPIVVPGSTFVTGQATVAAAGTPVRLSTVSVSVKVNTRVTVISKPGNTGLIYFANSKANCVAGTYFDGLNPGLAASLAVQDVSSIWIDAANNGDGASYYCEQ